MEKKEDSNLIISQYVLAVKEIKNAIIDSRYRAARSVNKEVLELKVLVDSYPKTAEMRNGVQMLLLLYPRCFNKSCLVLEVILKPA